jgi:hypothetical protein
MSLELIHHKFVDDIWIEIFNYLDPQCFIYTWIGFGLRKVIPNNHPTIWRTVFNNLIKRDHPYKHHNTATSILLRLNYKISEIKNSKHSIGMNVFGKLYKKRKCTNSGCLKYFMEINNYSNVCLYHNGRMKTAGLSCCKAKSFKSIGCKSTYHNGTFFDMVNSTRGNEENNEDILKLPTCTLISNSKIQTKNEKLSSKLPNINIK